MEKPITTPTCIECKEYQKNCCNDNPPIPQTIEDIKRIISLGFKLEDFLIAGEYELDIQNDEDWWKNNIIEFKGNLYKVNTRKKQDGSCVFINDGVGCALGESRPVICKIYPFWVNPEGEIVYEDGEKEYCYIGKQGASVSKGLSLIHETRESIHYYFSQIKRDCIENRHEHREIILRIQSLH